MVESKGQQQSLQSSVDEGGQHRGGGGGIGNPHAEGVDSRLHHRPNHRQHQGDDHRPQDHHQGDKALAVEERQGVRQLSVVVVFVVDRPAHEAGDDAHKHAHIQGRGAQNGGEIAVHGDLLSQQGVGHSSLRLQHLRRHAEHRAGDHIDEDEGDHRREGAAGPLLCPGTADGHGKQNVQIVDHRPSDVLHGAADGEHQAHVAAAHLHQLAQADHEPSRRHHGDDRHQNFSQFLQKIKINGKFSLFPGRLFGALRLSGALRLFSALRFPGRRRRAVVQNGHQLRRSSLHRSQVKVHCLLLHPAAEEHRGDEVDPLRLQGVQICLRHQVPGLHPVPGLHMGDEALPLQRDGLQPKVDQHLQPVVALEPVGVKGGGYGGHLPVHRAVDLSVRRLNGRAVPENLLGKHRVGNFLHRYGCAGQRGDNPDPCASISCLLFHNTTSCWIFCCIGLCNRLHYI